MLRLISAFYFPYFCFFLLFQLSAFQISTFFVRIELQSATGNAIVLGDDSQRQFIDKYLPYPEWSAQVRPGVRAPNVKVSARLNCKWTIAFEVDWVFDSEEEALSQITDFPLSVPQQGTLRVIQTSRTRFFLNATKTTIRPVQHIGQSVRFSFNFIAENSVTSL